MTTRLANALQRHRHLKGARVLCQKNGHPLRANMLAYLLERATRKAGLATGHKPRHAGPHVLRHTFCSHLSMRDAPARAVQKLGDYRDLGTTTLCATGRTRGWTIASARSEAGRPRTAERLRT